MILTSFFSTAVSISRFMQRSFHLHVRSMHILQLAILSMQLHGCASVHARVHIYLRAHTLCIYLHLLSLVFVDRNHYKFQNAYVPPFANLVANLIGNPVANWVATLVANLIVDQMTLCLCCPSSLNCMKRANLSACFPHLYITAMSYVTLPGC